MSTVYERLKQKLQVQRREGGISPLELADLPPQLKKIMRLLIREMEMSYLELLQATESMAAADRLAREELDQALEELTRQNWLKKDYDHGIPIYKVNLRRKAGSQLPEGIWTSLNDRIRSSADAKISDQNLPEK